MLLPTLDPATRYVVRQRVAVSVYTFRVSSGHIGQRSSDGRAPRHASAMRQWHEKCDQWQGPNDVNTIDAQLCKQELAVLSK